MNLTKINPYTIGLTLVFAGSLAVYYEDYRNIEWVGIISYLVIVGGWITIFTKLTGGSFTYGKNVLFKEDKAGWFKQRGGRVLGTIILLAVLFGNVYYMHQLGQQRKMNLLNNGNTATTTAVIDRIQARRSRSLTYYYAVFRYTVNGKVVEHPWHENHESDFIIGDKYEIKYVVDHPEMIMILAKLGN